jgi:hypothetical protein
MNKYLFVHILIKNDQEFVVFYVVDTNIDTFIFKLILIH